MNQIKDTIMLMPNVLETSDENAIKKTKQKQYNVNWELKNKEKRKEYFKKYYIKNKKNKLLKSKEYWKKNKKILKIWHKKYQYNKYNSDPTYRILKTCRVRQYQFLKGYNKSFSTKKLFGVPNLEFLWKYLESKFKPGMTRKNYGKIWVLDHIIPLIAFDPKNYEHQKIAFNYTNLQPLFVYENLSKNCKIIKKT